MNKQWRAEINHLRVRAGRIIHQRSRSVREIKKNRQELDGMEAALFRATNKDLNRIQKRISILQGRLS
jgi:septal ring factor EnvC (AmiA/AmiB activator)